MVCAYLRRRLHFYKWRHLGLDCLPSPFTALKMLKLIPLPVREDRGSFCGEASQGLTTPDNECISVIYVQRRQTSLSPCPALGT